MGQKCSSCKHFDDVHRFCKAIIISEGDVKFYQPTAENLGENCRDFKRWSDQKHIVSWFWGI
jgi:hypothetical protein